MPYLKHDGIQLYYETNGVQEGLPLVLSHCLADHLELWSDNIAALSAARPLVLWDCRSHGRSSVPKDAASCGIGRSTTDLRALLHALGIE